jgi:GNAT superfamily N-acetyltransferase
MTDQISHINSPDVSPDQLAELFRSASLRRLVKDLPRLAQMLEHSNLVVGAFAKNHLVGIARALTDFSYCCYQSDLAVARNYQRRGIGRELLGRVRNRIGEGSMLLLLSAPEAMEYYPKVGFEFVRNGWMIQRRI